MNRRASVGWYEHPIRMLILATVAGHPGSTVIEVTTLLNEARQQSKPLPEVNDSIYQHKSVQQHLHLLTAAGLTNTKQTRNRGHIYTLTHYYVTPDGMAYLEDNWDRLDHFTALLRDLASSKSPR